VNSIGESSGRINTILMGKEIRNENLEAKRGCLKKRSFT
jgi:hypothetical protein